MAESVCRSTINCRLVQLVNISTANRGSRGAEHQLGELHLPMILHQSSPVSSRGSELAAPPCQEPLEAPPLSEGRSNTALAKLPSQEAERLQEVGGVFVLEQQVAIGQSRPSQTAGKAETDVKGERSATRFTSHSSCTGWPEVGWQVTVATGGDVTPPQTHTRQDAEGRGLQHA